MIITMSYDSKQLESSIRKFAKRFGDTNNDCIARIAINVARQEAFQVQPYGKSAAQKKSGEVAIAMDYRNAVSGLPARVFKGAMAGKAIKHSGAWYRPKPEQLLQDPTLIRDFVHRWRGQDFRVRRLAANTRAYALESAMKLAIRAAQKDVGKAKGTVIDAGNDARRLMKRKDAQGIGKAYIRWAQRHAKAGTARMLPSAYSPEILLGLNRKHMAKRRVYNPSNNYNQAVRNVLNWYRKAVNAIDAKTP